jgi:hypothetical protein
MKRVLAQVLSLALVGSTLPANAQQAAPAKKTAKKAPAAPSVASQLKTMSDALAAQQKQIEDLRQELQTRDQAVQQLQQRLDQSQTAASAAQAKADSASAAASQQAESVTALRSDVNDLKQNASTTAVSLQETQKSIKDAVESPAAIHFKGVTLTPGGFVAAETVSRQRATSGDINTPFTGIPYPGNALSHVTENNFTARQSRLTLLAESKVGTAKLTGYYEGDFLNAGVTSNNRQSNSYVFRQRQIWAQAAFNSGWSFTGGQMWTLATEDRKGINNRQEALPMMIDPQYVVGFTWARQYAFRVVKDFGGKFALAASVEGPQATIGGRGFSSVTTNATGVVTTVGNNFINAPGSGGGLYNFIDTSGYTVNKAPDFLVKAAIDPGWGHYEVFGILSTFRNRVYPCGVVGTNAKDTNPPAVTTSVTCAAEGAATPAPSALGALNDTRTGGGAGASLHVPLAAKKIDLFGKVVGGDGIGRYGSSQLADLTLRPDGTQALIRTAHGMFGTELHPNKKLDIYAYFGAEWADRAAYKGYNLITVTKTPAIPSNNAPVNPSPAIPATTTTTFKLNQIGGYANPAANNTGCSEELAPSNQLTPSAGGTCAGDIRIIKEGTIGFWHKVTQGPKGGIRWGIQYSYMEKDAWSGEGGAPKGINNMVWTSFRYYFP